MKRILLLFTVLVVTGTAPADKIHTVEPDPVDMVGVVMDDADLKVRAADNEFSKAKQTLEIALIEK